MPKDRPFIDAHAKRGKPKRVTKKFGSIQFEQYSDTHVRLILPDKKRRIVSKKDLRRLGLWIVHECTAIWDK